MSQPPRQNVPSAQAVLALHPYMLTPGPAAQPRQPVPTTTTGQVSVNSSAPAPVPVNVSDASEQSAPVEVTTTDTTPLEEYAPLGTHATTEPHSAVDYHNPPPVPQPQVQSLGNSRGETFQQRVGDTLQRIISPLEGPVERIVSYVEGPVRSAEMATRRGLEYVGQPLARGLDGVSRQLESMEAPITRFVDRVEPTLTRVIRPAENMIHRVVDPIERRINQVTGEISYHMVGAPRPQPAQPRVTQARQGEHASSATDQGKVVDDSPARSVSHAPATVVAMPLPPVVSATSGQVVPDNNLCAVCLAKEKNALFVPCRHVVCCLECSHAVSDCPICRGPVTGVLGPIYL